MSAADGMAGERAVGGGILSGREVPYPWFVYWQREPRKAGTSGGAVWIEAPASVALQLKLTLAQGTMLPIGGSPEQDVVVLVQGRHAECNELVAGGGAGGSALRG